MKIELDNTAGNSNRVSAYTIGQITIDERVFHSSILVSAHTIDAEWTPEDISELQPEHFEAIIALTPEIVILGTGKSLVFPEDTIIKPLIDRQIGFEIMDTGAACRSYNFLLGEGREVVAALFVIDE